MPGNGTVITVVSKGEQKEIVSKKRVPRQRLSGESENK
jgi:hypothetical protein